VNTLTLNRDMTTIKKLMPVIHMLNINNEMSKSNIQSITIQNKSVILYACFVLFIVCLYICVCECLLHNNNDKTKHKNNTCVRGWLRKCRSIRSGASGLPYYCTPRVCIPAVLRLLAVCRHYKPKTKNLIFKCIGNIVLSIFLLHPYVNSFLSFQTILEIHTIT